MARIIDEVRPRFVFVENSPMLVGRGLAVVLGDLASIGFDARWGVLGASDVGAPHRRERCWIRAELADTRCPRRPAGGAGGRDSPHGEILNVRTANGSKTLANADLPKWRPISSTRYGLAQRPNGLHSQREDYPNVRRHPAILFRVQKRTSSN
ncbi:MAG: hypothetical protein EBS50_08720 [Sphingomonadaceae bacterium]|nr:hypothetical protein [Sphingomonadaceae bacterium]